MSNDVKALGRTWETFGGRDPLWAALTDRHRSPAEFFQSGVDELQSVIERARSIGIELRVDRALDFGCGIGRLTQAMARVFRECDGVDIAPSMIAAAKTYNQFPDTCRYHLNQSPDLAVFEAGRFTFIYTVLVLQHMPPEQAKAYVREFVRLLAPGGLLVFQIPTHHGVDDSPVPAGRTTATRPLPTEAFRARLTTSESRFSVSAGQRVTFEVTAQNVGHHRWPSLGRADGRYQVQVASEWLHADGSPAGTTQWRSPLPCDLAPGAHARVLVSVRAPAENGDYLLELDMVQEDVAWFREKGSRTTRIEATVTGGAPSDVSRRRPAPGATARSFRQRYPRLYRAVKGMGAGQVQSVITAIKRQREVRRRTSGPIMEMHCIPQDEVVALLRATGATLVDAEKHIMEDGFQSRRYWVVAR